MDAIEDVLKKFCTNFFYWWFNQKGTNTEQGFDSWLRTEQGQRYKNKVQEWASLQTPSLKWVKASERLPKEHKTYFVIKLDGTKDVGFYCDPDMFYSGKKRTWMMNHCVNDNVEAWLEESTPIPILTPCVEWTRVEDGLPESIWNDTEQEYYKRFSKQVNVFIDNGYVTTCAYNREAKKWFTGGLTKETGYREVAEGNKVTHWMPLPTKPNDI